MPVTLFGPIVSLYRVLSIVLAFVNFMLLLISLLSPSWTAYYSNVDFLHIGLWTVCSTKFGCSFLVTLDVIFAFTRVFMVLAFLLSIIALVSTVPLDMIVTFKFHFVLTSLMTSVLTILAGICTLVSIVLFEIYIHERRETLGGYSSKWGAILTYFICVMLFVTGGYNYFAFKYSLWGCCRSSSPNADPEKSVQDVNEKIMNSTELTMEP